MAKGKKAALPAPSGTKISFDDGDDYVPLAPVAKPAPAPVDSDGDSDSDSDAAPEAVGTGSGRAAEAARLAAEEEWVDF